MYRTEGEIGRVLCQLSVVIPVLNEHANLPVLFDRLYPVLDRMGIEYEVIFIDDGSTDGSGNLLADQQKLRSKETKVITFSRNFGQHMAIVAAFDRSMGETVITLDADLQNPPEEIPRLIDKVHEGHDYVGSYRVDRQDTWFRRWASIAMNTIRSWMTPIKMRDQGCMLRAYSREIAKSIVRIDSSIAFVPAIGHQLALRPVEIPVMHEERYSGRSKYSLLRLARLNFNLITSCTLPRIHLYTVASLTGASMCLLLVVIFAILRILFGPENGGKFTLLGTFFLLAGVVLVGIGLIGEYLGNSHIANREKSAYQIKSILEG